jgi:Questin oxidase-like
MNTRRAFLGRSMAMASATFVGPNGARTIAVSASPPAASDPDPALIGPLLKRNRERHPGSPYSNHLSMGLLSLAALGASTDRIRAKGESELKGIWPFPTGGPAVTRINWRDHLRNPDALPGLRAMFEHEIATLGMADTLRLYLPTLLPGLSAAAFHPLIRTGYGVRFGDAAEVAMGLAYWAVTFWPLGPLVLSSAERDPTAALAAVRRVGPLTTEGRRAAGIDSPKLNIVRGMRWASTLPGFGAASSLRIGGESLDSIARAAIRLHVASGDNFTALHGVTATHAYRMIEPFVPDRSMGRRYLWQALVAVYVYIDAPNVGAPVAGGKLPGWDQVIAEAAASDDDHKLKLTDIAREECRHYADPMYLRAAAMHLSRCVRGASGC